MKQNNRMQKTASLPKGIILGVLVCIMVTLLCSFILAWLVHRETVQEHVIPYGVMIITFISAALGCNTALRAFQEKTLITSVATRAIYFALLLALSALFFDDGLNDVWETALIIVASSVSVGLIGVRKSHGVKSRRRK